MRLSTFFVTSALFLLASGCALPNSDNVGSSTSAGGIGGNRGIVGNTPADPPPVPNVIPSTYVTIAINATEPEILAWLRWQKVHVEIDSDGDARVYDGAATRRALVQYRRMLVLRLDVIAENLANQNTTRDARGDVNPYRRKFVTIDPKGNVEIKPDPSPFRQKYDPSHPDADLNGVVKYSNVFPPVEFVNAQEASREYEQVVAILQRLDPTALGPLPTPLVPPAQTQAVENPLPISSR